MIKAIRSQCKDKDYSELEEFIRMWRRNFVENMKPRYLPRGWNVDHKMQRTFGEHSIFKNIDD